MNYKAWRKLNNNIGCNKSKYLKLKYITDIKRKSGELMTSTANALINRYILKFCEKKLNTKMYAGIEGDDSLSTWVSMEIAEKVADIIKRLGIHAKVKKYTDWNEAEFC